MSLNDLRHTGEEFRDLRDADAGGKARRGDHQPQSLEASVIMADRNVKLRPITTGRREPDAPDGVELDERADTGDEHGSLNEQRRVDGGERLTVVHGDARRST